MSFLASWDSVIHRVVPKLSERRSRNVSVALLCTVNLINYMDRYTVSGILSDIIEDFGLETWQAGLLQTAFIICYFASAPIFGYLGDRYSRKWIMILGIIIWGICTLTGTFMPGYWSFLAFRAAIGFGEAGFTTIAPTVLSDLFGDGDRAVVLAVFYFAIPVGSGLGYIVAAAMTNLTGDWRWGLRITPILIFITVILMIFFMADPERGETEATKPQTSTGDNSIKAYVQDLVYLLKNRSFVLTTLAFTCLTFCTGALSWWGPLYVEDAIRVRKEYGLESSVEEDSVAFIFGFVLSVSGVVGLVLGSGLSYKLRPRFPWVDPVICGLGLVVSAPFLFVAIGMAADSIVQAFVLVAIGETFLNMNWAIVVDLAMYVVIPTRRSSAEAVQLMFSHALGEAGAPYLIGLIAGTLDTKLEDHESKNPIANATTPLMSETERAYYSFQYSLFFTLCFEVLGGLLFLWATKYVVSDRRKAEEESSGAIGKVDLPQDTNANSDEDGLDNAGFEPIPLGNEE